MPCSGLLRFRRFALLACILAVSAPALAGGDAAIWRSENSVDDQAVRQAIQRGLEALWKIQTAGGTFEGVARGPRKFHVGATAQGVYALLECGVSPQDKRIEQMLTWLAKQEVTDTYDVAFRILAMTAAHRRRPNAALVAQVRKDCEQLYNSISKSDYGYNYNANGTPTESHREGFGNSDGSNSQYALLAVWMAVEYCQAEVPEKWWELHKKYWLNLQSRNGGWGYTRKRLRPEPYLSMSAAGLASMFVCLDHLHAGDYVNCSRPVRFDSIERGLKWMDQNFAHQIGKRWPYYTLYGVERVGLASGYKFFGQVDWYKQGVDYLLKLQKDDGSWEPGPGWGANVNTATCYALLFLQRGLHPVLFNKLRFKGDWNNRPRDLANLTRWMTTQFEKPFQWQIINIDTPVQQWHDAPILYISGSRKPKIDEEGMDKIRRYVLQGGTIFSVTECNGVGFRQGVREMYAKLFPSYELTTVPADDPIRNVFFNLRPRPQLYRLSNGVRTLAIHCDYDLARFWQLRQTDTARPTFEIGANIAHYATSTFQLRPRGTTHWPEAPKLEKPDASLKIALVDHGQNALAEPLALERLARMMGHLHNLSIEVAEPVEIQDLPESKLDLAIVTGTGTLRLSKKQSQALKEFTDAGSMVLLTPLGGDEAYAESLSRQFRETFGVANVLPVPAGGSILSVKDHQVKEFGFRNQRSRAESRLEMVVGQHGPVALATPYDVLTALVGYPSKQIKGYDPQTAFALMRNILIHLAKPDES
jgi:hypothetical protein